METLDRNCSTMAQTAAIYNLSIDLSDVDRGVYEQLEVRIARHPSETAEYMLVRVLAYCLSFRTESSSPKAWRQRMNPQFDSTHRTDHGLIEVGLPDASRLHRGSKMAPRAAVYTHRKVPVAAGRVVHKSERFQSTRWIQNSSTMSPLIDRRSSIGLSITEQQIYLTIGNRNFSTAIQQHRIS
jgi:uncharacterized protein YaeQ